MAFDFLQEYEHLSTSTLLAILQQPQDYQPEALSAARTLLAGRTVTEDDTVETAQYIEKLENERESRKSQGKLLQDKLAYLLEPVINPKATIEPRRWVNLLLAGITLLFAWNLYVLARLYIMKFGPPSVIPLTIEDMVFTIRVAYLPVIVFLLYKRRKAGWILLMVDRTWNFLSSGVSFFYLFEYPVLQQNNAEALIWPVMLNGFFILFLWRKEIREYFGITERLRRKAVIATAVSFLLYTLLLKIWFY